MTATRAPFFLFQCLSVLIRQFTVVILQSTFTHTSTEDDVWPLRLSVVSNFRF